MVVKLIATFWVKWYCVQILLIWRWANDQNQGGRDCGDISRSLIPVIVWSLTMSITSITSKCTWLSTTAKWDQHSCLCLEVVTIYFGNDSWQGCDPKTLSCLGTCASGWYLYHLEWLYRSLAWLWNFLCLCLHLFVYPTVCLQELICLLDGWDAWLLVTLHSLQVFSRCGKAS
jgi:hypothetical protein